MKQTFRCRHRHKSEHFSPTTRLAEDRYATCVTPKRCNVLPNPREHSYDVQQAHVRRAGIFFAPKFLKVQIAIYIQPVIVSNHNNVVISCEVFAIVGKKIVTAAIGKPTSMHVNHDRTFMGTIDLGCPKIQAEAILTRDCGSGTPLEYECIFICIREVLSISNEMSGILVRTDATILQRVANSAPRLRTRWRHEAPCARSGGTIGHAFEKIHTVAPKAADFSSHRFRNRSVRGHNRAVSTSGRD